MKFSVIIPTYNDWQRLQKCVMTLENQTLARDEYEIIVVDNSENGVIPEEVSLPSNVQLIHESQPGSYAARNRGAKIAIGEIYAFTDSDCIPDQNWLKSALIYFNDKTDLVGGKVEIFQSEEGSKYGYVYERVTAFPQDKNVPQGRGVTANLLVKNDVFKKMGGFNTEIKSGGDWDFTLRCTEAGHRMVYADDVLVKHPARNLYTILEKHFRITCGGALNMKKEYGHSPLRMLGSHIKGTFFGKKKRPKEVLSMNERVIVSSIDLMKFMYRTIIYVGIIVRLINPDKIRE